MIRLDRYRLFVAVAEKLSMSEAADALCLTRSAVSHAVKALEDELGRALFVRCGRELELTAEGRYLFQAVAPHIAAIENAAASLREDNGDKSVSLASPHIYLKAFVLPRLSSTKKRTIKRFKLEIDTVQGTINRVQAGEADLGLVNVSEDSLPEDLIGRRVMMLHGAFICRKADYPGWEPTLGEVLAEPLVTLPSDTVTFRLCSMFCAEHGYTIRPIVESHQLDILHDLVAAGIGIGTSYREIAQADRRVRVLPVREKLPAQPLLLIRRKDAPAAVLDAEKKICQKIFNIS